MPSASNRLQRGHRARHRHAWIAVSIHGLQERRYKAFGTADGRRDAAVAAGGERRQRLGRAVRGLVAPLDAFGCGCQRRQQAGLSDDKLCCGRASAAR